MSHVLANWEQVQAGIVVSEDRSRVLWPERLRRYNPNAAIWEYQPGIVLQKRANRRTLNHEL